MQTILKRTAVVMGLVLGLTCTFPALADDSATPAIAQKMETFKGTVSAVDAKEKTVSVKAFLMKKTFNVAYNCNVSLEDNPVARLADLHAGQIVKVGYEKEQGVLIAREITQKNEVYKGHITVIDPVSRSLVVKSGLFDKNFVIAQDCSVALKDDKLGTLDDLKVGHTVKVIYEHSNDALAAERIEQKNEKFVGTVRAIDASTKTIKAKNLFTEKKFSLANNCKIVVDGMPDAKLNDLRIGETVAFSYEDVDGVLVANRIGHDAGLSSSETQTAKVEEHTQ